MERAALNIHDKEIASLQSILELLDHSLRMKILRLIHQNGSLTVTELLSVLQINQSVVSRHLGLMYRAGILKARPSGRFTAYYVDMERLEALQATARKLLDL